jgi:hypothetical protein
MKRISVLKTITTIAFIITVITVAFGIPFTLMLAVATDLVPNGLQKNISSNHLIGIGAIVYLLLTMGVTALIALALHSFKEALTLFEKRMFFDVRVIALLTKTGKMLLTAAAVSIIAEITSTFFASDAPYTEASFTYGPTLLFASLGLLFLVLSDVFTMAKNLKEENDLTV